ncbi:hypothetical protein Tco_1105475 [Tanacetum coccineum]
MEELHYNQFRGEKLLLLWVLQGLTLQEQVEAILNKRTLLLPLPSGKPLAEEMRSKMLSKHKDNMMLEKKKQVDTTPIHSVNSSEPTLSIRPTNVEVPKELPKVSMVNTSLKKLKYILQLFDEKALAITALKDELRKLKGIALVDNNVSNHPSDPELHQEEAAVLRDLVDHIKANYPLDPLLESACKYTKLIQEMLSKISKTLSSINSSGKQ